MFIHTYKYIHANTRTYIHTYVHTYIGPLQLADFLLTSSWVPSEAVWAILLSGEPYYYTYIHTYIQFT